MTWTTAAAIPTGTAILITRWVDSRPTPVSEVVEQVARQVAADPVAVRAAHNPQALRDFCVKLAVEQTVSSQLAEHLPALDWGAAVLIRDRLKTGLGD